MVICHQTFYSYKCMYNFKVTNYNSFIGQSPPPPKLHGMGFYFQSKWIFFLKYVAITRFKDLYFLYCS